MCGLVGIAGALDYKDKEVLAQLLVVSSLRGMDSTGVAQIGRKPDEVNIAKSVGNPYELFNTLPWERKISPALTRVLIGHTRKATVGEITRQTAHPFHEDHIVGVHNGTLENWRQLPLDEMPKVDSHALYASVAKMGIKDTVEFIKGAYALVWFDQDRDTLNFLRNGQRDLWYCRSKDLKKIYWASEYRMMLFILERCNIDVWEDAKGFSFFPVPMNEHVELGFNEDRTVFVKSQTALIGGVTKTSSNAPFGLGRFWENWDGQYPDETDDPPFEITEKGQDSLKKEPLPSLPGIMPKAEESKSTAIITVDSPSSPSPKPISKVAPPRKPTLSLVQDNKKDVFEKSKVLGSPPNSNSEGADLDDEIPLFANECKGHGGTVMSKAEFENAVKDGCQWCGANDITFEEQKKNPVEWIDNHPPRFLCNPCTKGGVSNMVNVG